MKKNSILIICFIFLFAFGNINARADEIENEINNSLSAYKGKEYNKAIKSLEFAAHKIRQKKAGQIEKLFPVPLAGWTAGKPESVAIGRIFMGGAISGSREYRKGNSTVRIEIVSDSPLIGVVTGILSNPMMASVSPIFKIEKVKGNDAVVEWNETERSGNIKIVVDNKVLITVSGNACLKKDILAYANVIDYAKIQSSASK